MLWISNVLSQSMHSTDLCIPPICVPTTNATNTGWLADGGVECKQHCDTVMPIVLLYNKYVCMHRAAVTRSFAHTHAYARRRTKPHAVRFVYYSYLWWWEGWLTDWLADWLTGWLVGLLVRVVFLTVCAVSWASERVTRMISLSLCYLDGKIILLPLKPKVYFYNV